jgi:hypothetical protein
MSKTEGIQFYFCGVRMVIYIQIWFVVQDWGAQNSHLTIPTLNLSLCLDLDLTEIAKIALTPS